MASVRAPMSPDTGVRARGRAAASNNAMLNQQQGTKSEASALADKDEYPLEWMKRVITRALWSQRYFWVVAGLLIVIDAVFTTIIMLAVKYTEIDYATYMQQAQVFLKGQRAYHDITGDTGPCVYPALHLYIFALLSYATNGETDIWTGQLIYFALYIACQIAAMAAYKAAHIPPIMLPLLIFSKRLHSIFVLRLFNDCWTMLFFYIGVYTMCKGRWRLGSTFYSLALAVKMNMLLYAPAMAAIYLRALGLQRSIVEALRVLLIQAVLALPFLQEDATSYFASAFNLSRAFLYKWTVNLRFVDEELFLSQGLARGLLVAHLVLCVVWLLFRWTGISKRGLHWMTNAIPPPPQTRTRVRAPSGRFIVTALFTSNLIGITLSRSLHYQFYAWYAHQIPLLVYLAKLPRLVKIVIPLCIEAAWNTFPSTPTSSLMLLACHVALLLGLWVAKEDDTTADEMRSDEEQVAEQMAKQWDRPT